MAEHIREGLYYGYVKMFGRSPEAGMAVLTPTEEQTEYFNKHGLAPFCLPLAGYPIVLLIDTFSLPGAKFAWIQRMRTQSVDILISDGRQSPNTRKSRTAPEQAAKRSIQFDPGSIEGIHLILRYPPRVESKRSPAYKTELSTISKPQ